MCPFNKELSCDFCELYSENENKCSILIISETMKNISDLFYDIKENMKKRPAPPEIRVTPPVQSLHPMNPTEARNLYNS